MKKFFMFAAMASVALVSCVKNEVVPVADDAQQEISFASPVLTPNLKSATEVQNNFPIDMGIGVWAHYFDNQLGLREICRKAGLFSPLAYLDRKRQGNNYN